MNRLLLHTNAPWASTGYGVQAALFAPRLAKHYELAISAFYGLEGGKLKWNDIPILPGAGTTFGNETIEGHADNFFEGNRRGGLILTLMDAWVLNPFLWRQFNVASWVPIDHDPAPPLVPKFFAESGAVPIAMSRFGEERLSEFDPLYCPHAVDTEVFQPRDQAKAREMAGLPRDAFIIGIVAANKGFRKSFPESLLAFKAFREHHPDALLYLHTEVAGKQEGIPIAQLIAACGLPEDSVLYCNQYRYLFDPLPPPIMSFVYSAMDVLLNPAKGEGFGLPVLEAQACGTPVIVTDFSAMSEVCGAGWKVSSTSEWSAQCSWQARPDVEDIADALLKAYGLAQKAKRAISEQAREHALKYDIETVMADHMLPALKEVGERLEGEKPFIPEKVAA